MADDDDASGGVRAFSLVQSRRRQLGELLVVAGVLAFAIALISDSIGDYASQVGTWLPLTMGLTLVVIVIGTVLTGRPLTRRAIYRGYVLVAPSRGRIVPVPRYEFAESIARQLYFVIENASEVARRWLESPEKVIRDAAEAFVLRAFSYTLDSTFPLSRGNRGLIDLERSDLSDLVSQNPVLDFLTNPGTFNIQMSELVALMLPGGTLAFERIRIRLPSGSIVKRADGQIQIHAKACKVTLGVTPGTAIFLPDGFDKHYLGLLDPTLKLTPYPVSVSVDVRFGLRVVLARRSDWLYTWIDEFLKRLDLEVSEKTFYHTIDWSRTMTLIDWMEGRVPQVHRKLSLGPVTSEHEAMMRLKEILESQKIPLEMSDGGRLGRVRFGSSVLFVHADGAGNEVMVRLHALVLQQVGNEAGQKDLMICKAVNDLNSRQVIGRYSYRPDIQAILLDYELLAGEMEAATLVHAVRTVATAANDTDDDLQRILDAGRRASEVQTEGRLDDRNHLVIEPREMPDWERLAFELAAWDNDGRVRTIDVRAADGATVRVIAGHDGQPVKVTVPQGFGEPDAGEFVVTLALTSQGFIAVALDSEGRPISSGLELPRDS